MQYDVEVDEIRGKVRSLRNDGLDTCGSGGEGDFVQCACLQLRNVHFLAPKGQVHHWSCLIPQGVELSLVYV